MFFGEKSFEVADLMRIADDGRGMILFARLQTCRINPTVFYVYAAMLAELYASARKK